MQLLDGQYINAGVFSMLGIPVLIARSDLDDVECLMIFDHDYDASILAHEGVDQTYTPDVMGALQQVDATGIAKGDSVAVLDKAGEVIENYTIANDPLPVVDGVVNYGLRKVVS